MALLVGIFLVSLPVVLFAGKVLLIAYAARFVLDAMGERR
jgi:hypothetical protein